MSCAVVPPTGDQCPDVWAGMMSDNSTLTWLGVTPCVGQYIRGLWYGHGLSEIRTWIRNYIHCYWWELITHPCSNFNSGLAFLTYPAVPYDDLAVPDIFPSGTIWSPKNSITMMLIRHVDRCLHFHDQSRRFLRELWLCKVTARWPDLTHLSVHSLVNGVRSTRTSFLVRVIGSTATTVRKVSEVTKEMKLHDYD